MNLGPMEVLVILIVALLIFGPKNLPKLGTAVGKTVRNVREGMEEPVRDETAANTQQSEASTDDDSDRD